MQEFLFFSIIYVWVVTFSSLINTSTDLFVVQVVKVKKNYNHI